MQTDIQLGEFCPRVGGFCPGGFCPFPTFSYPFAFNAAAEGVPIGMLGKCLVLRKLESWGYQAVKTV